ncbi:hypothetical protein NAT51_18930 [Flavobacterium amniphilum]|uniref:hypothetical protein n=1 Tax=Flavobacterium amniphilum TaxID=1834035 RepID=UPI002029DDAE|nr:hypothetical protein [Flavobacterium amniphilum]MCL9807604.1 hypothetical protein [Flavobacterium amniphilum]
MQQYKCLFTILLILTSGIVFAQKIEKTKNFQVEDLKSKKTGISFRFWIDGQIIEIEQSAELVYTGRIINIAEEQPVDPYSQKGKSAQPYTMYFQINELPEEKVICAFEIMNAYKISDLPDGKSVPGWNREFLDGYSYMTEQNLNGEYQEKNYSNPSRQTDLQAATNLMDFYAELKRNLGLGRSFNTFFNKLKVGCYKTERGGYYLQCRKSKMYVFFYRLLKKKNKTKKLPSIKNHLN